MSELDLIPPDYARRHAVRRRLRAIGAGLAVLACVVGLSRGALGLMLASEKEQVAKLEQTKLLWQQRKSATDRLTGEARATEKQLAALDELRGREHLRHFLEALDDAYVDKVWFDEIRYFRLAQKAPAEPAAQRAEPRLEPRLEPRIEQRVGMSGHATNHVTLAEFMRRLERQPAVAELSLVDTSPRSYPHALIIDFKLALVLDQKAKARP